MKITIEPTAKVVQLRTHLGMEPLEARVWQGETDKGTPVYCFIARIALAEEFPSPDQILEFTQQLHETAAPRPEMQWIPLRLII